jgi:hypothetical protein
MKRRQPALTHGEYGAPGSDLPAFTISFFIAPPVWGGGRDAA